MPPSAVSSRPGPTATGAASSDQIDARFHPPRVASPEVTARTPEGSGLVSRPLNHL